jgi:hypothetical protein
MVVVVAAAGGVKPALRPRALQPSRPLHRGGTLTLASPRALRSRRRGPSDLRPSQTQVRETKAGVNPQNSYGSRTEAAAATESKAPASRAAPLRPESRGLGRGGRSARACASLMSVAASAGVRAWRGWCSACARSRQPPPFFTAQMFLFTCRASHTWPQAAPARLSLADIPGPLVRRSSHAGQ